MELHGALQGQQWANPERGLNITADASRPGETARCLPMTWVAGGTSHVVCGEARTMGSEPSRVLLVTVRNLVLTVPFCRGPRDGTIGQTDVVVQPGPAS